MDAGIGGDMSPMVTQWTIDDDQSPLHRRSMLLLVDRTAPFPARVVGNERAGVDRVARNRDRARRRTRSLRRKRISWKEAYVV